ncbi:hypothetical protein [Chromobacterium violaceum]|uniref:hypothetical protein n=1 Tax=Chromobacterium violaceum TaxID=536 RepID=UPI0012D4360C|nr:hypothetical protein [Chromobacterium violaceum]
MDDVGVRLAGLWPGRRQYDFSGHARRIFLSAAADHFHFFHAQANHVGQLQAFLHLIFKFSSRFDLIRFHFSCPRIESLNGIAIERRLFSNLNRYWGVDFAWKENHFDGDIY